MPNKEREISDAVAIEKERQKTKRYFLFLAFFTLIALTGIFVVMNKGGNSKVEINLSEGKILLSQGDPIIASAEQPTKTYNTPEGPVEFTTGEIDGAFIEQLKSEGESISPTEFIGENFINEDIGIILTVLHPDQWEISHNPAGLNNSDIPVNTISTADGSNLAINVEDLMEDITIEEYVEPNLNDLINSGQLDQMPEVLYDYESQTAFLFFNSPETDEEFYMKLIIRDGFGFLATATYSPTHSDPERIDDLAEMVGSFTLIDDVGY